jgi:hypothetical protein
VPGRATPDERLAQRARFVRCRPRPSIPRTQRETTLIFTAVRSTSGNSASRASASCCLESFSAAERADLAHAERLDVEQHGGGHKRAGEAAAAGLVGAGDPADAEAAVELEEARPVRRFTR